LSCDRDYKIEKHILGNGAKVTVKSHKDSTNIEHVKVYYANGEIEKEFTQVNSRKNGLEKTYYESKNQKYDYVYSDDELNGIQKEYFDLSQKKIKKLSYYENGRMLGNQFEFYENGEVKRHIIINPAYEIYNEVKYNKNGKQINLHSNRFSFGEFNKEVYSVGDTLKLRTFIFFPKNYEIKYFSSFHSSKDSFQLKSHEIVDNIISQNFNLLKSENYIFDEKLVIRDLINDTLFVDKHSLVITPNSRFY